MIGEKVSERKIREENMHWLVVYEWARMGFVLILNQIIQIYMFRRLIRKMSY